MTPSLPDGTTPARLRRWPNAESPSRTKLSIGGEVERPLSFDATQLAGLPTDDLVADFHCREGWSRLGVHWRGIRLSRLLELAGARDTGCYVTLSSGPYTVVLTREQAEDESVLLAFERDHKPISRTEGLPRLVGPSKWDCFLSVKSVERIELTSEPQQASGPGIALARLNQPSKALPVSDSPASSTPLRGSLAAMDGL
jgi:DMSO/TMAO reductase YedYZ molybdopterin-dependent catalytic subunit